jgi:hypothetical protein
MQVNGWCIESVSRWRLVPAYAQVVLVMVMGCGHAAKNTLHVTSVTPDAAVDVTGTLNGKAYELSVDRKDVPLYIAYYEPIEVPDVGKDFPARFDDRSGEVIVQVPNKGAVRYSIKSVHEKN